MYTAKDLVIDVDVLLRASVATAELEIEQYLGFRNKLKASQKEHIVLRGGERVLLCVAEKEYVFNCRGHFDSKQLCMYKHHLATEKNVLPLPALNFCCEH